VAYQPEVIATDEELPSGYGDPFTSESYGGPADSPCCESYDDAGCCDGGCCNPAGCNCGEHCCCGNCGNQRAGMYYSEVQLMFMRAHVLEESLGKLSERYEFSPRFIVGYEAPSGLGVRARYWNYGRTTPNLADDDDALRLEFDIVDVEGTSRFRTSHTDLIIAGGFRWADMEAEVDDETVDSQMPGITLAADLRSTLCRKCRSEWAGVCGVRWTLLGGDWEGDDDAFIEPNRDDNMNVQELYGGFEYLCHCRGCDVYARVVFEVQNWHSDALGDTSATDSIGFVGPGMHAGMTF
jgi:hypothetical protein